MGDDLVQDVIQKRNINVSMIVGENILPKVFTNVLHVLGIIKNLFSLSKVTSLKHIF